MRILGILLASSTLVFAANGFAQESTKVAANIDVKALVEVVKTSPVSPEGRAALQQLEQAADAGDVSALTALGYAYSAGKGVAQDPAKAAEFFQKAADAGDKSALTALGYAYSAGKGVAQDPKKAVKLFLEGLNAGDKSALVALGYAYSGGKGVKKDRRKAVQYFEEAANNQMVDGYVALRYMDQNRLVKLIQTSLSDSKIYHGPINGLLTKNTIQALNSFCKNNSILAACTAGPLSETAIRKYSALLPLRS